MDGVRAFCQEWGDVASVGGFLLSLLGMIISLVGFVLTLRGQRRIRRAAQEAVKRVALHLLTTGLDTLLRLVTDAREAARQGQWQRAIDRCAEARLAVLPLPHNPHLLDTERLALTKAEDKLRLVLQYIENHRLPPGSNPGNLPDAKRRELDETIRTLGEVRGRLHGTALEA